VFVISDVMYTDTMCMLFMVLWLFDRTEILCGDFWQSRASL